MRGAPASGDPTGNAAGQARRYNLPGSGKVVPPSGRKGCTVSRDTGRLYRPAVQFPSSPVQPFWYPERLYRPEKGCTAKRSKRAVQPFHVPERLYRLEVLSGSQKGCTGVVFAAFCAPVRGQGVNLRRLTHLNRPTHLKDAHALKDANTENIELMVVMEL